MTRREKLLNNALRNPDGLSFADFQTLLTQSGWIKRRQTGSHELWYSPKGFRLPIQRSDSNKAKGYQVKQFLTQLKKETQ